jgi:DNA end-binding protein Ku
MAGTENEPHPLLDDADPANEGSSKPRALWKGTLAFGLVSVPVGLHRAVAPRGVRFHDLHDQDGGRILRRAACSIDGASVPYGHIVKGFEVERGRWVTVTADELEAVDPVASRSIEIHQFVDPDEIDPMLHDRSYWLVPEPEGADAYALLGAAMERLRRVAVARLTMRARQHLAVLRPVAAAKTGLVLSLTTLAYADEILPVTGFRATAKALPERELGLAERLVSSRSGPFRSDGYRDEHREKVLAYLHRKAEQVAPEPAPEPSPAPATADLASALEASLAEAERHKMAA